MTLNLRLIQCLLRAYPASWRNEYGAELEALLLSRRLTVATVADVVRGAAEQRLKRDEPWKLCAGFLLVWTAAGIACNTAKPFSPQEASRFTIPFCMVLLAGAFWATLRESGTIGAATIGAGRAALIGALPEFLVCFCWALGVLHPAVLSMKSLPSHHTGQIALLFLRSEVPVSPWSALCLEILAMSLLGIFAGGAGATVGRLARCFKPAVRRA